MTGHLRHASRCLFILLCCTVLATWDAPSAVVHAQTITSTCDRRYNIPSTCNATRFVSDIDGQLYRVEQSVEKVLCLMKAAYDKKEITTLNPMHFGALWESYRYARELGIWIHQLLNINTSLPLKFAFYPTRDGNQQDCLNITSEPYIKDGGTSLCRLLYEIVEFGDGSLVEFMLQAMDYGYDKDFEGAPYADKWKWAPDLLAQIRRLGFEPYVRFLHQYNTRFVYDPTLDEFGQQLLNPIDRLPFPYYGLSGGGGSGTGFEISCLNIASGIKTAIIIGGGGMNAGVSSGGNQSIVDGYGVGNAGISVFIKGKTLTFGGFAGKSSPYGKVILSTSKTKNEWKAFAAGMKVAMENLKKCHATPGTEVILEGGGGGGAGLGTFINGARAEREPHAIDMGYQFQFALGNSTLLAANSDPHEIPFVICPFAREMGAIPWKKCMRSTQAPSFEPSKSPTNKPTKRSPTRKPTRPTTRSPTRQSRAPTPVPTRKPNAPTYDPLRIYECASMNKICQVATFVNAEGEQVPYQYAYFTQCFCYVQNLYLTRYLAKPPDSLANCTAFLPSVPDPNDHFDQAWCKHAGTKELGCPKYPLCNKNQ